MDGGVASPKVCVNEEADEWVRLVRAGDPRALDWLVRTHWERVQRLLLRVWGRHDDLEDLVQNTFLETLRALPNFRGDSSLSTFVLGIAVRVARRARRPARVTRESVPLDEPDSLVHTGAGPEQHAHKRELLRRLHRALEKVAEPKRVAFLLWSLEGMSPADIAVAMQASVPATRSRILYAQRELLAAAERDPYLSSWLRERLP
jgi:RNA polymerase sigma-70 factor (ECF subfamily)